MQSTEPHPFLSLRDVTLRLYDRTLFKHTNWVIHNDEHWAVIGPNGSGKSTLMKALCGHVPVTTGNIHYHFAEQLVSDGLSHPREAIGYVTFEMQRGVLSQETSFHQARWNSSVSAETLPVEDYLSEKHVLRRNPYQVVESLPDPTDFLAQKRKVIELLEIEPLLDRRLIQLSNGEMRKMRIAQALMRRPRLLILDNPFTGLDNRYRQRLSQIVGRLMQEAVQIIVVTTRQDEIPAQTTHALVIDKQQMAMQGIKAEVLADPIAQRVFAPDPVSPRFQPLPLAVSSERKTYPVLLQIENLNVSYGGKSVLQGIDWTVRRGEHWALLGPNGSGKTTLLSIILRDNPQAYANRIALFGRQRGSGESIWEVKQRIGWVSPELHLYYPRRTTCLDAVCSGFLDSVGLHHQCTSQQRDAAEQWLEHLGLVEHAQRTLAELSQGEQRLALIARALVKRPQLLVLDEPCQGLDATNGQRVLQAIDFAGRSLDTSLIYVTHRPEELPRITTHVLRLGEGRAISKSRFSRM